jgi:hypothetical protein
LGSKGRAVDLSAAKETCEECREVRCVLEKEMNEYCMDSRERGYIGVDVSRRKGRYPSQRKNGRWLLLCHDALVCLAR